MDYVKRKAFNKLKKKYPNLTQEEFIKTVNYFKRNFFTVMYVGYNLDLTWLTVKIRKRKKQ